MTASNDSLNRTLADYLAPDIQILSIGLNPSWNSVEAGFYFATPTNRFWKALNASTLLSRPLEPGEFAMSRLLNEEKIGFTDLVKRPTRSGSELRMRDYREWAPVLEEKILTHRPVIAWFHGKVAWKHYLKVMELEQDTEPDWGEQVATIGQARVFVTPNPSPANAAFSLPVITDWYDRLADLRTKLVTT